MEKEGLTIIELEDKYYILQENMINNGILKGLTHPDTIKCSQELDIIINNFQKIKWNSI